MATISKLLTALNECTEWGQVFILDSLASYQPKDEREAQNICERVTPRLSHANAAVVLSAVKVCMKTDVCPSDVCIRWYCRILLCMLMAMSAYSPRLLLLFFHHHSGADEVHGDDVT